MSVVAAGQEVPAATIMVNQTTVLLISEAAFCSASPRTAARPLDKIHIYKALEPPGGGGDVVGGGREGGCPR